MKKPLTCLLVALFVQASALAQQDQTFTYTGAFDETYTVPTTGWYRLEAFGAQGGSASNNSNPGGKGGQVSGLYRLTVGTQLRIGVGGQGASGISVGNNVSGGGGGGASSIAISNGATWDLLLVAGGGGGGGADEAGGAGLDSENGGRGGNGGNGGSYGNGGAHGGQARGGAGGGGYSTAGGSNNDPESIEGGRSYGNTNGGGASSTNGGDGGWGGGGEGGPANNFRNGGGGGGGGYSGGGGGARSKGGGGGGSHANSLSYVAMSGVTKAADAQSGPGSVIIKLASNSFQPPTSQTSPPLSLTDPQISKSFQFAVNSPLDEDVSLGGDAMVVDDFVELTPTQTGQSGNLLINAIPADRKVRNLVVKFEVQTTGESDPPADGFSFNFGPEVFHSSIGEDGAAKGLTVTFDTFDNGGDDTAPAVEVVYDSETEAGISFDGRREGERGAHYPVVEDPDGNLQSLTTGDIFVPVQVDLSFTENGVGLVNVWWNDLKIHKDVEVQYEPARAWSIGFGARTGGFYQAHRIRNIAIEADTRVRVNVTSTLESNHIYEGDFPPVGNEDLASPPVGSHIYNGGDSVTFNAPEFIYLDRYKQVLTGTEDEVRNLAYYKAERVSGSFNGEPTNTGASHEVTTDAEVNWHWKLEYLAEVNSGTDMIEGLKNSSITEPDHEETLGRNFRPKNYDFNSVVYSEIVESGSGLDTRYQPSGYAIENAPGPPERCLQLSGKGDHLRTDSAGTALIGADGSFTIEFWARRDPLRMTADQNVVALGSSTGPAGQLRAGFTSANLFFLSDNAVTVTEVPEINTPPLDNSWHHWAAVNDTAANTVTLYRDGKVVHQRDTALDFSGDQVVTVGARANGPDAEGFFPGGINNVRVWETALGIEKIRRSRAESLMATSDTDLGLELPFDDHHPLTGNRDFTLSSEGKNVRFDFQDFVNPEGLNPERMVAAYFPGFHCNPLDPASGGNSTIDSSERGLMHDYRRVFWMWEKEFGFKVTINAVGLPDDAISEISGFPYLRTADAVYDGATGERNQATPGVITALVEWIAEEERLEVGTIYRTSDRRYTLQGVSQASGEFSTILFEDLQDDTYDGRVAKSALIEAVSAPGSLYFDYGPTRFRAQLAIGEGLDFSSPAAMEVTPPLPDDADLVLVTANDKPGVTGPEVTENEPGWTDGEGDPWQWDVVGQKWYPLKPGTYTLEWEDKHREYTHHIEVIVDFPGVQKEIAFLEDDDGKYLGTAPDYLREYMFNPTGDPFPAKPGAHYHYLVSPAAIGEDADEPDLSLRFPVDLDPSATDRWSFLRQAFSEYSTATVDTSDAVPRFTEASPETRTVLVFSYRDDGGVASGNLSREKIAVRVVESLDPNDPENNDVDPDPGQTVASRITSTDDTAGYGSGYIVNEVSNYNAAIYDRDAAVGQWGPVYPVNWSGLYTDEGNRLSIGYYENPGSDPASVIHPPVGWPYVVTHYDTVEFPKDDPAAVPPTYAPAIYLASQLGSEGIGQKAGTSQLVFDPAKYADLTVYNQPVRSLPGFNPNEEHALVAPSNLAAMTGDDSLNIGQSAFFALQNEINRTDPTDPSQYTSEPFVLAQYTHVATGQPAMMAYRVLTTREGMDPFPLRYDTTHLPVPYPPENQAVDPEGNPVPQPPDPQYEFSTVTFAGDLVKPIYPLSLVTGPAILPQNDGDNVVFEVGTQPVDQQTLWHDKNKVPWVVAGDVAGTPGRFEYRFWYPLAQGFWLGEGANAVATGTPVKWLPVTDNLNPTALPFPDDFTTTTVDGSVYGAQPIDYSAYWRENYPVLKRGETLAYPGGEYKVDHPAAPGLPGVIGWASAEVAFDSATRDMEITNAELENFNARFMRLLDVHSVPYARDMMPEDLTAANPDKVSVSGSRWYFKELSGSLSRRFYYDTILSRLVVRGRINNLESGDPTLTQAPIGISTLEPNVLSEQDVADLEDLAVGNVEWTEAIEKLFVQSEHNNTYTDEDGLVKEVPDAVEDTIDLGLEYNPDDPNTYNPFRSLGTGAVLVPNPGSLTEAAGEEKFVTLVENNHPQASGAVTLHVIRLGDERYRGAIAVITPRDAFDEKVELTHSGDFGGNTDQVYYQWWVHDVAPLAGLVTPDDSAATGWLPYQQGLGLNSIRFEGRPDMTLADKLFYVRYGHADELAAADSRANVDAGNVLDPAWRLVQPDDAAPEWGRTGSQPVPYQWAGAANSPQLQADGSRRFLPQLLMGWVKRVLDAVNPYEARFSADFTGDAPATYSSMLVEAGRPYLGPVALNAEKDAIENVGLIELYETVLQRARDLVGDQLVTDPGIHQALLLAATRLAVLYELLANEAYADAQNPSLSLVSDDGSTSDALVAANPWVFSFMNQVPSLLQEELALLRGTDYLKAYPVENRLFWNYFKGLGEAAYNANYNISDPNQDGLIDENDAAILYPMGHGDAWGHYLSAAKMHYGLLQRSNYDWQARAELYALLGNVIPTDYLDEQSFARTATARARAGLSIVKATYRDAYVADPAAQWQGYTDSADPARAWGVSEWSARAGQGAHFDWLVGNAILPAEATDPETGQPLKDLERLDRLDRETAQADLRALAGSLGEIQQTLDGVNQGLNPLGLDPDAFNFGVDSWFDGAGWPQTSFFEQVYERAVTAADNARQALDFVSATSQNLRQIADDTSALKSQAVLQDLDYRNRLIALLGTPYSGAIGPGKIFKEGYTGPDLLTYMYLDATTVHQVEPKEAQIFEDLRADIRHLFQFAETPLSFVPKRGHTRPEQVDVIDPSTGLPITVTVQVPYDLVKDAFDDFYLTSDHDEYPEIILNGFSEHHADDPGNELSVDIPISRTSQYAFTAPEDWGRRESPGEIQNALGEMLQAEIALESALDDYQVYLNQLTNLATFVQHRIISLSGAQQSRRGFSRNLFHLNRTLAVLRTIELSSKKTEEQVVKIAGAAKEGADINITLPGGNIPSRAVIMGLNFAKLSAEISLNNLQFVNKLTQFSIEFRKLALERQKNNDAQTYQEFNVLIGLLEELSNELAEEPSKRLAMAGPVQALNMAGNRVRSLEAEAQRLISERAAKNKMIASRAQRNRYGDMVTRLSRDEAVRKYENALDHALRYAWLAAKAYDYETSLSPGHPANAVTVLEDLVRVRQLGSWDGDTPLVGNGGLAEVLGKLRANYLTLEPQIGLNGPQYEEATLSLRTEAFRIPEATPTRDGREDDNWRSLLSASWVPDLNRDHEFTRYCRPFAAPDEGPQPGFKIPLSTEITSGRNFFGRRLGADDHTFSRANFATRIRSVGVEFHDYDLVLDDPGDHRLADTPRVYLVPTGIDVMRYSDGAVPRTRGWNVVQQRIPVPFPINISDLRDFSFSPSIHGLDGSFADLVRFGDFQAATSIPDPADPSKRIIHPGSSDDQLYYRSVWNTGWALFIPASSLGADQNAAKTRFIETVTDIKLTLVTFSTSGM